VADRWHLRPRASVLALILVATVTAAALALAEKTGSFAARPQSAAAPDPVISPS
jgi:hypothetical protein